MSIGNFFSAAGQGLNTYMALAAAMEDKKHQRVREGVEDSQWRERMNLDHERQTAQDRETAYQHSQDADKTILDQATKAGIYGITPGMLHGARDGNQTQTGQGAGQGGQNVLQSALRSLQVASQQPGYDTHQQVDLGNGLFARGPDYQQEPTPHLSPVYGQDNEVGAFDNRTGAVHHTGFMGRAPTGLSPNNPRNFQYIQDQNGQGFLLDKTGNTITPAGAGGGQTTGNSGGPSQFMGTHATPGQPERDAASAVAEMTGAINDIKKSYADNGYQAPGYMSQELMRHGGSLGSVITGAMDPKFQQLYNKQQLALNNLLYLKSGKVITDNEFKRLRGFLEAGAGDTPQTLKDKMNTLDQEVAALAIRAGRASNQIPVTTGNGGNHGAALKQKYGLE